MRRTAVPLLVLATAAAPAAAQRPDPAVLFDSAYQAWDAGDYHVALDQLDRLLALPGADAFLADVAVLTGERYRTVEVAPDGRDPRWSPDGRHVAWDAPGAGAPRDAERRTVVARVEGGGVSVVAELEGYGATFSPDGSRIAWLYTVDPAALAAEQAAIRRDIPVRDSGSRVAQRAALTVARARHARVRVRDLETGRERDVRASEPVRAVAWSGGEPVPWIAPGAVTVSPRGTHIVYDDDGALGLLTIGTSWQRTFPESGSPAFSADGSTLAFITRDDDLWVLRRVDIGPGASDNALPETVLVSDDPLASPAVSADGSLVAFQRMGRENWEVWVTDGAGEPRRLTHDVQHDLFPRFLAGDRVLVIKGEARHRRSYVYPVAPGGDPAIREWVPGSGEGMRLFHNNTVRTVAPEYEWAVSPDATKVLIVAERDGDTITPERGVYLTDLGQPVTLEEVRARVREQLTAERALRE